MNVGRPTGVNIAMKRGDIVGRWLVLLVVVAASVAFAVPAAANADVPYVLIPEGPPIEETSTASSFAEEPETEDPLAKTKPFGLTLTPAPEALAASWNVTSTTELASFRVRTREVGGHKVRVENVAASPCVSGAPPCFHEVPGLVAGKPYEVQVKTITTKGTVGGTAKAVGIPEGKLPPNTLGKIKFAADAAKDWDQFVEKEPERAKWRPWIKQHLVMLKGYPPIFGDNWVEDETGLPVIAYHDSATDHTNGMVGECENSKGEKEKGECYAPLSMMRRMEYTGEHVMRDKMKKYAGQFTDDINWHNKWRDGHQECNPKETCHKEENAVSEPEASELAALMENVRSSVGETGIIEMNSQFRDIYPLMKEGNSNVAHALAQVDIVTVEHGLGEASEIHSAKSYAEYFEYVDALHERGIQIRLTGKLPINQSEFEYHLANYYLGNAVATNRPTGRTAFQGDLIDATAQVPSEPTTALPESGKFWRGFDVTATDLGEAENSRKRNAEGVWSRTFSGGLIYTVEPGAEEQTIKFTKAWHTIVSAAKGEPGITEVTLKPAHGVVLVP